MKKLEFKQRSKITLAIILAAAVLALVGITPVVANNGNGNGNGYNNGYQHQNEYHHNGHYYPYAYHNNHRGYWNQNSNGVRIFINL